ncbi:MAG: hypothetical protein Q9167_000471 [Letrouitia subvulpina]
MEQSVNASKVTVEYSDPSGIFSQIETELTRCFPLRNLHWTSSARPLRSISSLYIELVRDSQRSSQPLSLSQDRDSIQKGGDAGAKYVAKELENHSRPDSSLDPKKERRHQIPGLRQTPYLKIYFFRCNDVENYRSAWRKSIRDWVKENTRASQNRSANAQENHDAFEWLIVHVEHPQDSRSPSRYSKAHKDDTQGFSRSSTSIIEKLRADFNGTSKTAVNRVAQVQIGQLTELNQGEKQKSSERSVGWDDLTSKLKALILMSFDLRVTQYENDIKEKESQRNLPGWNFNTFFVLKEGLARGFESVGLVEDALAGYHELSVGLNTILEYHDAEDSVDHQKGHFKHITEDLSAVLRRLLDSEQLRDQDTANTDSSSPVLADHQPEHPHNFGDNVLDFDRKPFRELILANNISRYDFQCYLFAKEVSLLLRLANVTSFGKHDDENFAATDSSPYYSGINSSADNKMPIVDSDAQADLNLLAEICQRSLSFLTSVGRTIRQELRWSIDPLSKNDRNRKGLPHATYEDLIEDLIAAWTYSVCQYVLHITSVDSLSTYLNPLLRQLKPPSESGQEARDGTSSISREGLPSRTSSLHHPAHMPLTTSSPDKFPSVTTLDAMRLLPPPPPRTGYRDLAASRAQLVLVQRRVLCTIGLVHRGFETEWAQKSSLSWTRSRDMEDIPLADEQSTEMLVTNSRHAQLEQQRSRNLNDFGILNHHLLTSITSEDSFYAAYEELTASAIALYVLGDNKKSAEAMTADLAMIRFNFNDYAGAASYFHQLASFYAKDKWDELDIAMLDMYMQCLRRLDRKEDMIRVGLQIMANIIQSDRLSIVHPYEPSNRTSRSINYMKDIFAASKFSRHSINAPLNRYFGDIFLDPYLCHFSDHDGFQLTLELTNFMAEPIQSQEIQVRIVSVELEQQHEILLFTENEKSLKSGFNRIPVVSKTVCPGLYRFDKVSIRVENMLFHYDRSPPPKNSPFTTPNESEVEDPIAKRNQTDILLWPDPEAFEAWMSPCRKIHLEKSRSIDITLSSGRNYVARGSLVLRSGSAGLRLHTAETQLIDNQSSSFDVSQPSNILFGPQNKNTKMQLRIPYSLEKDLKVISVRIEVSYQTECGDFVYACSSESPIQLPLGVNVQDIFKEHTLFSKFTVSTSSSIPVGIIKNEIRGTKDFSAVLPSLTDTRHDVFTHLPLCLIAKISRNEGYWNHGPKKIPLDNKLILNLQYTCLDQEIYTVIEDLLLVELAKSGLQKYSRLLTPALSKGLRLRFSSQELESIGILREIGLGSFDTFGWKTALASIAPDARQELEDWIIRWHMEHPVIPLHHTPIHSTLYNLIIPVEIPSIPIVVTAYLDLVVPSNSSSGGAAAIGQAIPAELNIRQSINWAIDDKTDSHDEINGFFYEIQANPDVWLVGGQRRTHFNLKKNESNVFHVILIPQKAGHLIFPSIEIRMAQPRQEMAGAETQDPVLTGFPSCEVDYRNQGDSLLVVPHLSSTTTSLDSGDRAWLLGSASRLER